ncbi:hypothetical protein Tco_1265331 [Tanacetum coccineum]
MKEMPKEMEHYLVTAAEIQAVEKERKAKNILLMAIPKEHIRRFHGMDDAKEIWEAIGTRFGEGLEKGYDRFQQLLSQLEAHGAKVSTEDTNHKFLRSLPPAWSNLAMTMRTNPEMNFIMMICTITLEFLSKKFKDLLHEDLEQIDDVDIEEMDINWQIAMIAIRMKKFYKKTGRRVRVDGKTPVEEERLILSTSRSWEAREESDGFADNGLINGGHTEVEETNHALMAISSSNELGDQEAQILAYSQAVKKLEAQMRIGMKAVKEKEQLQKTLDSWKDSSKNLWRLIDSGMSSNSKVGLGFEIQSNNEVLSYEEERIFVFNCQRDSIGKPLYSRFTKTNDFKGVPHPLSGDYTPKPQEEIDDSLYVYVKILWNTSELSFETESEKFHHLSHLIKDCDYYEKKMARKAEVKRVVNTGNWMEKPVWTKANRVNHSNKFVLRSVQLNAGRPNFNSVMPNINTGRTNINSVRPKVNDVSSNVNTVRSRQPEHPLKNMVDRGIFDSGCSGAQEVETDLNKPSGNGECFVSCQEVKKLEGFLKRRNMVLSDSEKEEPEAQGRKSQDDHLASLVQGLVTPSMTKVNASGEEQVEDITPNTLEAAKNYNTRNLGHCLNYAKSTNYF